MANLIVQENGVVRTTPAVHGEEITIKAPCDCSEVTGVQIANTVYPFYDAAGNLMPMGTGLFTTGNLIKVLIDTENNRAMIINHAIPNSGGSGWINVSTVLSVQTFSLDSRSIPFNFPGHIEIPEGCIAEFEALIFGAANSGSGSFILSNSLGNCQGEIPINNIVVPFTSNTIQSKCFIDPYNNIQIGFYPSCIRDSTLESYIPINNTKVGYTGATSDITSINLQIITPMNCNGYMLRYRILEG